MKNEKISIAISLIIATGSANATLDNGSLLFFEEAPGVVSTILPTFGSYFAMSTSVDADHDGVDDNVYTPIDSHEGLLVGWNQTASGSHTGLPGCTNGVGFCDNTGENPLIDNPWAFFGNTGMHSSVSPVSVVAVMAQEMRCWTCLVGI